MREKLYELINLRIKYSTGDNTKNKLVDLYTNEYNKLKGIENLLRKTILINEGQYKGLRENYLNQLNKVEELAYLLELIYLYESYSTEEDLIEKYDNLNKLYKKNNELNSKNK